MKTGKPNPALKALENSRSPSVVIANLTRRTIRYSDHYNQRDPTLPSGIREGTRRMHVVTHNGKLAAYVFVTATAHQTHHAIIRPADEVGWSITFHESWTRKAGIPDFSHTTEEYALSDLQHAIAETETPGLDDALTQGVSIAQNE